MDKIYDKINKLFKDQQEIIKQIEETKDEIKETLIEIKNLKLNDRMEPEFKVQDTDSKKFYNYIFT